MTGILELLVVVIVIALLAIFKKQIGAMIIKAKRMADRNIQTSIKIEQAINVLKKKQNLIKQTFKEININISTIAQQAHKELQTAVAIGDLKVAVRENVQGEPRSRDGITPKLQKGEQFDVRGFSPTTPTEYYDIGTPCYWGIDLFDIISTNKNIVRYNSLQKLINVYSDRNVKTENLLKTINDSIVSLNNDKEYVKTMESLIEIEKFDDDVDLNINNILAEISAIEKQLEMEEKLHGAVVEETPKPVTE